MFGLIEKLRQKPDRTKKQIAFLIALGFSGIIFVIWLSVIYPDWREGQKKVDKVSELNPSPLSSFSGTFREGLQAIGDQFGKLKEVVSSISTSTYYSSGELQTVSSSTPKASEN